MPNGLVSIDDAGKISDVLVIFDKMTCANVTFIGSDSLIDSWLLFFVRNFNFIPLALEEALIAGDSIGFRSRRLCSAMETVNLKKCIMKLPVSCTHFYYNNKLTQTNHQVISEFEEKTPHST